MRIWTGWTGFPKLGVNETTIPNNGGAEQMTDPLMQPSVAADVPLQGDFFVCDFMSVMPKHDLATMEHPLFALTTRPDRRILNYVHNGAEVTITPSVKGRATIFDADILIFCISQLIAALNRGQPTSRNLTLTAYDLLQATGRETSGDGYRRLRDAFERLAGTRITTNIPTGPAEDLVEVTSGFGLIESWQIARRSRAGRMVSVRVTLSEWLYRAVMAKSVLTLDRGYFDLRKPLERRLYVLARKHCGRQPAWRISVRLLAKKSGSSSPLRVFRSMLREIIRADALPEYHLLEEPGDILCVTPRAAVLEDGQRPPILEAETLDLARGILPGADIYALEAEWRAFWQMSGHPPLRQPGKAFLGWVRKKAAE